MLILIWNGEGSVASVAVQKEETRLRLDKCNEHRAILRVYVDGTSVEIPIEMTSTFTVSVNSRQYIYKGYKIIDDDEVRDRINRLLKEKN